MERVKRVSVLRTRCPDSERLCLVEIIVNYHTYCSIGRRFISGFSLVLCLRCVCRK
jgi:hypothetical protein